GGGSLDGVRQVREAGRDRREGRGSARQRRGEEGAKSRRESVRRNDGARSQERQRGARNIGQEKQDRRCQSETRKGARRSVELQVGRGLRPRLHAADGTRPRKGGLAVSYRRVGRQSRPRPAQLRATDVTDARAAPEGSATDRSEGGADRRVSERARAARGRSPLRARRTGRRIELAGPRALLSGSR